MPVFIAATSASATVAFDRSVARHVRDAFVDCARRTQVNKGRVEATRGGTRISNLSNRGDLRNAGVPMFPLCFAPVKRDDVNGWRAVQALVARVADSLRGIKSAAHALTVSIPLSLF